MWLSIDHLLFALATCVSCVVAIVGAAPRRLSSLLVRPVVRQSDKTSSQAGG